MLCIFHLESVLYFLVDTTFNCSTIGLRNHYEKWKRIKEASINVNVVVGDDRMHIRIESIWHINMDY